MSVELLDKNEKIIFPAFIDFFFNSHHLMYNHFLFCLLLHIIQMIVGQLCMYKHDWWAVCLNGRCYIHVIMLFLPSPKRNPFLTPFSLALSPPGHKKSSMWLLTRISRMKGFVGCYTKVEFIVFMVFWLSMRDSKEHYILGAKLTQFVNLSL